MCYNPFFMFGRERQRNRDDSQADLFVAKPNLDKADQRSGTCFLLEEEQVGALGELFSLVDAVNPVCVTVSPDEKNLTSEHVVEIGQAYDTIQNGSRFAHLISELGPSVQTTVSSLAKGQEIPEDTVSHVVNYLIANAGRLLSDDFLTTTGNLFVSNGLMSDDNYQKLISMLYGPLGEIGKALVKRGGSHIEDITKIIPGGKWLMTRKFKEVFPEFIGQAIAYMDWNQASNLLNEFLGNEEDLAKALQRDTRAFLDAARTEARQINPKGLKANLDANCFIKAVIDQWERLYNGNNENKDVQVETANCPFFSRILAIAQRSNIKIPHLNKAHAVIGNSAIPVACDLYKALMHQAGLVSSDAERLDDPLLGQYSDELVQLKVQIPTENSRVEGQALYEFRDGLNRFFSIAKIIFSGEPEKIKADFAQTLVTLGQVVANREIGDK
jgi:hypothetical protein